jgi:hypothetical protein
MFRWLAELCLRLTCNRQARAEIQVAPLDETANLAGMQSTDALVMIGALALAGCGLFPSAAERAVQKSPNFRAGYNDGCAAASATGANPRERPYREDALYKASQAYRAGWGNGYSICRREGAGAEPGSPLDSSVLNPSPGQH